MNAMTTQQALALLNARLLAGEQLSLAEMQQMRDLLFKLHHAVPIVHLETERYIALCCASNGFFVGGRTTTDIKQANCQACLAEQRRLAEIPLTPERFKAGDGFD